MSLLYGKIFILSKKKRVMMIIIKMAIVNWRTIVYWRRGMVPWERWIRSRGGKC